MEAVRDQLGSEATILSSDDGIDAFPMDDGLDVSEVFISKFKPLVGYADHVVGADEHSRGGHGWEAGYIDQPTYRKQTRAFYRTYKTEEEQYAAYGMVAHDILSIERVDRAYTRTTPKELRDCVADAYAPD